MRRRCSTRRSRARRSTRRSTRRSAWACSARASSAVPSTHCSALAPAEIGARGPRCAERSLGVLCRDDSPKVRLAAVQALDKLGDAAVIETADDLVKVLGDTDATVADAASAVIKARKARMIGALVRGMETDKLEQGRRV